MNRWLIIPAMIGIWVSIAGAADNSALPTKNDRLSYAMGVETGKAFKKHNLEVNPNAFSQGLKDSLAGTPMLMSDDEIRQELQDLQHASATQLKTDMKQTANKNKQLGGAFLEANKDRLGVVTTPSGLQYKVIAAGSGPKPTDNDVVTVDYEGRLLDGKIFDSSYERGQPMTFRVNAVIAGWQEALKLMPAGSTWELYIPSELAYGEQGAQGAIGPNEVLIFKVHLISVQKQGTSNQPNSSRPAQSAQNQPAAGKARSQQVSPNTKRV